MKRALESFRISTSLVLLSLWLLWILSGASSENGRALTYNPGTIEARFQNWLGTYDRSYENETEQSFQFGIYQSNVWFIDYFNDQNKSFKLIDNKFADMTNEEFKATYLGFQPNKHSTIEPSDRYNNYKNMPTMVDWRKQGAVTPTKDQGECGSCWAFSTVAAIEGINKIKTGHLVSLSEQELVDCDVDPVNQGCKGGVLERAFHYVKKIGGITTERLYPYGGNQGSCNIGRTKYHAAKISGYEVVKANNEISLQAAVMHQPVSVAIDASGLFFQLYSEGIFNKVCRTNLNHGVSVVGYEESSGDKYWIVKNSWGTEWGESSYVRMKRDSGCKNGICGIATKPSYPVKE